MAAGKAACSMLAASAACSPFQLDGLDACHPSAHLLTIMAVWPRYVSRREG